MSMTTRRGLLRSIELMGALGLAAKTGMLSALAQDQPLLADPKPFSDDFVQGIARELASRPFQEEKVDLPAGLQNLTYDQYRDIRFKPEKSIWRGEPHGFSIDLFHPGFYYTSPVDIYIVNSNEQSRLNYVPDLFTFGPLVPKPSGETDLHYAGFRMRYPLNSKDVLDEFLVYQGASYFRAVGKDLLYGLSARGLAIDTGQPQGEEFPFFRSFWIRTPEEGAKTVVVFALLNSQSATGAYRFTIKPGDATVMDVEAMLFPRRDIEHAGIATLTSMYLFGTLNKAGFDDYRSAVHDSDGLLMVNGREEWIWRPLSNPKTLQVSAFMDRSPRGFGLMQRRRQYQDFLDLEAKYERRPSLWVEPIGDWGGGWVRALRDTLAAGDPRQYRRLLAARRPPGARVVAIVHLSAFMVPRVAARGATAGGAGALFGWRAQRQPQKAPVRHRFRRRRAERPDNPRCRGHARRHLEHRPAAQYRDRRSAAFFRNRLRRGGTFRTSRRFAAGQ